jgi:hypothetical protein
LSLALTVFLLRSLERGLDRPLLPDFTPARLTRAGAVALVTALTLATGLGWSPGRLSGLFAGLTTWLGGWTASPLLTAPSFLLALIVYAPVGLIFGALGLFQALRAQSRQAMLAGAWFLAGLALTLFYPARSITDVGWLLLPLLYLASVSLIKVGNRLMRREQWAWVAVLVALLCVLAAFAYLQLAAIEGAAQEDKISHLRLVLAALALGFVVVALFDAGWDRVTAQEGVILAVGLMALSASTSATWRLNFAAEASRGVELLRPEVSSPTLALLVESVEEIGFQVGGHPKAVEVALLQTPPPHLAWALRDFEPASTAAGSVDAPAVVLVPAEQSEIPLQAEYVGQTLEIAESRGWTGLLPPELATWWTKGKSPTKSETWLLLLRKDLASLEPSPP